MSWIYPTIYGDKPNPIFYKAVVRPKAVPKFFDSTVKGIEPHMAGA